MFSGGPDLRGRSSSSDLRRTEINRIPGRRRAIRGPAPREAAAARPAPDNEVPDLVHLQFAASRDEKYRP
jgi:hypothetical protein